jgi:hypothetical protein
MSKNQSIEESLYPQSLGIKTIVDLIRKLLLVISSNHIKYPYESPRMNMMLFEIVSLVSYQIEQIEGILCIAEKNLYLYPSSFVISRTVLEINILIEWMLNPEEESKRIVRYIRYLKTQLYKINHYEEWILESDIPEPDKSEITANKQNIERDIDEMISAAKNHQIPLDLLSNIKNMPDLSDMIKENYQDGKQSEIKTYYYVLSKFAHGMRQSIYRYYDPNFENYDPVSDWNYPLYICYSSIIASSQILIHRFSNGLDRFNSEIAPILSEISNVMSKVFVEI